MQGKGRPERNDEPAVTFELEETPRKKRSSQTGVAAGAAAVAGAGLVSSAAASEPDESLDVFDQIDDAEDESGDVPVTSFQDLTAAGVDPEFPPIDFAATNEDGVAGDETTFGASADVGGGFVMSDDAADEAFGTSETDIEPVLDSLVDDEPLDEDLEAGADMSNDIDLP